MYTIVASWFLIFLSSEGIMEVFKVLTRRDAEKALESELKLLTDDIPNHFVEEKKLFAKQMSSYQSLFKRFIETTEDIDWQKIKLLPDEDVCPSLLPYSRPRRLSISNLIRLWVF